MRDSVKFYLTETLSSLAFFSPVLIPTLTTWGRYSLETVFLVNMWGCLAYLLFQIPCGALSDWLGRRRMIGLGLAIDGAALLLLVARPDAVILYVLSETLFTLGVSLSAAAGKAATTVMVPQEEGALGPRRLLMRTKAVSLVFAMASALIGAPMAAGIGYRAVMVMSAVPWFAAAAIALTMRLERDGKRRRRLTYRQTVALGLRHVARDRRIRIQMVGSLFTFGLSFSMVYVSQTMLMALDVPVDSFGIFNGALFLSQVVVLFNYERLVTLFGRRRHLDRFTTVAAGTAMASLFFVRSPYWLMFCLLVAGLGLARGFAFMAYVQKLLRDETRATVLAVATMFSRLTIAAMHAATSIALPRVGPFGTMLVFGSVLVLFGAFNEKIYARIR